jgi:hypothetical protein
MHEWSPRTECSDFVDEQANRHAAVGVGVNEIGGAIKRVNQPRGLIGDNDVFSTCFLA